MTQDNDGLTRRGFLAAATVAGVGLATGAQAQVMANSTEADSAVGPQVQRNVSALRMHNWQDYFDNTRNGVILCDISARALHYWSEDQSIYRLYPTSVPLSEELTRLGRTEVIEKVVAPTWRPTASMLERNPEWPREIAGGDPGNPLGPLALYLSWPAYRIHGTHDTRKIGRRSSNGCIGLYNEHIRQLFELSKVGTQVMLI
jgi:L,D-transpeptidase ErfK/SrfK